MIRPHLGVGGLLIGLLLGAPHASAQQDRPTDRVLLIGGRTLAGSDRLAEALDEMVAVSGVLGDTRFERLSEQEATSPALDEQLSGRKDVRAIIAFVGNLSLLQGVDPSLKLPARQDLLSSRRLQIATLRQDVQRLQRLAAGLGADLTVALAPLSLRGRIEVAELLTVGPLLQSAGSTFLDLQTPFDSLDAIGLFSNGIDQLTAAGQEELARLLFRKLLDEEGLVPARDAGERTARRSQRAFEAWMAADDELFQSLVTDLIAAEPANRTEAVRQAALATARDGLQRGTASLWINIPRPESPEVIVGLGMALALCRRGAGLVTSDDPAEAGLIQVSRRLVAKQPREAWILANQLVESYPERVETWLALKLLTATMTNQSIDHLRHRAMLSLAAIRDNPIHPARWRELLDGPETHVVQFLPTMFIGARPYRALQPAGPILDQSRRRASLGAFEAAVRPLKQTARKASLPPSWLAEMERIARLRDGTEVAAPSAPPR